jgi:DNA-binding transcriptional regulator YhcF (GntR family)
LDAKVVPPYIRIVSHIKHQIADGELGAGDRVPSTRQLARDWNVAPATAAKALSLLGQEGVVRAEPRVGTIVAEPAAQRAQPRRAATAEHELNRRRIVRAAIEMADEEGLSALSMRGVAGRLGVATMSLYRHVGSKDDLLEHMVDEVMEDFSLPAEPPDGWRVRLDVMTRVQWASYRRHPWMAGVTSLTRPLPSAALLKHTEWALAAVDGHGLSPETMLYVHILIYSFVQGLAANFELEIQARAETGLTDDEWMRDQDPKLAAIVAAGSAPTFADVVERLGGEFDLDLDRLFEFGLRSLLDGLAVVIEGPPRDES